MSLAKNEVGYVVLAKDASPFTMTYLASGELVETADLKDIVPDAELTVKDIYQPQEFCLETRKLVPVADAAPCVSAYLAKKVSTDDDEAPDALLLLKDYGSTGGPSKEYLDLTEPGWETR